MLVKEKAAKAAVPSVSLFTILIQYLPVFQRNVSLGCDPDIVSAKGQRFVLFGRLWPDIG
jgi:hypothetical protein